jgi:glucose/arabinose dehydrogenase
LKKDFLDLPPSNHSFMQTMPGDLPPAYAKKDFESFPPSFQADALVAFHGTARDQVHTLGGYLVARVRFKGGKPVAMEDLVRGWNANGDVWGRPAGLLVMQDGSVLISDDFGGRIFRLRYTG